MTLNLHLNRGADTHPGGATLERKADLMVLHLLKHTAKVVREVELAERFRFLNELLDKEIAFLEIEQKIRTCRARPCPEPRPTPKDEERDATRGVGRVAGCGHAAPRQSEDARRPSKGFDR